MMQKTIEDITLLYIATFDRAPDSDGAHFWLESPYTIEEIADRFFYEKETQAMYADKSTEEFVTQVYRNVLDREPDSEGLAFWTDRLDSGEIEKSDFIIAIIDGTQGHPGDTQTLEYKEEVGLAFVDAGLNDGDAARDIIQNLELSDEGVQEAIETIEILQLDNAAQSGNDSHGRWGDGGAHGPNDGNGNGYHGPHDGGGNGHGPHDGNGNGHGPHDGNGNGGGMPDTVAEDGIVTDPEQIDSLLFMYQEEKLAGDVYEALYDEYGLKVFENISKAEDVHMQTIDDILVASGVDMTELHALGEGEFSDEGLQQLYNDLIEMGSESVHSALEVGVLVEETDIADLEDYLNEDGIDPDMELAYSNLLEGSYHHLDAFNSQLDVLDGTLV
jgi:hypothetical protein